jgi:F-type H+-transporting ATPase subunit c
MKKLAGAFAAAFAVLLFAPAVFAQATEPTATGTNWVAISAAFGMAIAAAGCGYAQSRIGAAACEGMARNPGSSDAIRAAMILGLVFVETLVLFTFAVVLLKVK